MADHSAIEWTEATLNMWTGCTKVSPGCARCYIPRTMPFRTAGRDFVGGHIPLVFHMDRLEKMVRRRKPTLYFVNSLSDVFHEDVPDEAIDRVFGAMGAAGYLGRGHTFQVLTKRAERMHDYMLSMTLGRFGRAVSWYCEDGDGAWDWAWENWPLPNVWLGVSVENRRFVHRADLLRDTPAAVRFISAEPLLGPLVGDLTGVGYPGRDHLWMDDYPGDGLDLDRIDWLIAGGESGRGARRLDLEWMRNLRDHCRASGTAYFVKQLGGLRPGSRLDALPADLQIREMPARAEVVTA